MARLRTWLPWARRDDRRWARAHVFEVVACVAVVALACWQPALAVLVGLLAARVARDRALERARRRRA